MSKNLLTIHKEIQKKAYADSPVGQAERAIRQYYDDLMLAGIKLTDDQLKQISQLRKENEDWQLAYIERTNRQHREEVDAKLLETMTAELKLLDSFAFDREKIKSIRS